MSNLKNKLAWNSINCTLVLKNVLRLQHRIYKAFQLGKKKNVQYVQIKLINSFDAKLLSILQVTTFNQALNTRGFDQEIMKTDEKKLKLVYNVKLDGNASLILKVNIPKSGNKETRLLGISITRDRAKQQLYLFIS